MAPIILCYYHLIIILSCSGLLLLSYRYGDRTPKSDAAKVFAMIWILVGLVMFGLFSGAVTAALTVVVVNGGPTTDSEKLPNVSITPLPVKNDWLSGSRFKREQTLQLENRVGCLDLGILGGCGWIQQQLYLLLYYIKCRLK